MHVVVWSYRVAAGREDAFETLYRSDGDWTRLFRRDPAYLGTELLRDVADSASYLTIDRWRSRDAHEAFVASAQAEHAALDRQGDALTLEETQLGTFGD